MRRYLKNLLVLILTLWLAVIHADPELEEVARLDKGPGNITVTPQGKIVLSLHQFFTPQWRVVALGENGEMSPFPNSLLASGGKCVMALDSVLGLQSDSRGVVWMLDNGMRNGAVPKLLGWDTRSDQLARIIHLPPPVTVTNSFVNDLAIDEHNNAIYIADPARGDEAALIVVDLSTGLSRRLLQGHKSVVAEDIELEIEGKAVQTKQQDGSLINARVGINPIALDRDSLWLYYGPMHGTSMYRVKARDLLNPLLSEHVLAARVERYSAKPICDGISIDNAGNIYVTDVVNNAIGMIDITRRYRILVKDARLSWPDAFSFGPDGKLYTVANQLHKTPALNAGEMEAIPPYFIFRITPPAQGQPGR